MEGVSDGNSIDNYNTSNTGDGSSRIGSSNNHNTGDISTGQSQGQISQLSSALRQVHLSANSDKGGNSETRDSRRTAIDQPSMKNTTGPSSQGFPFDGRGQVQQDPMSGNTTTSTNTGSNRSTRISKFFQNQPLDGYTLFSHRSAPNGFKVAIVLSELKLKYQTIFLDFNQGEHRAPEFVAMNPNARVPALIDHGMDNLAIWESGAIILHLVNKNWRDTGTPTLWSDDLAEQSQINAWLFFQTSGHAPMIGQALHFKYFHSQKIESAIQRYTDEVRRVYGVVEMALAERREALVMEFDTENAAAFSAGTTPISQSKFFDYPVWLVGDRLTIADLCFVPWNNVVDRIGINIKAEFPEVYKWTKHMMRRPAVIRAFRGE